MRFGIYVHWPFCAAKCPYCDFNSHVRTVIDEDGWVDAIARELDWTAQSQGGARPTVETIFFGGGTPSLMSGRAVGAVIDKIARLWRTANDVEVTLESNPASVDAQRFADYRGAGVNRVSLGVQALNDTDRLELYVHANEVHRQAILVARLDNLGKGASGAAVQNIALMLGLHTGVGAQEMADA